MLLFQYDSKNHMLEMYRYTSDLQKQANEWHYSSVFLKEE